MDIDELKKDVAEFLSLEQSTLEYVGNGYNSFAFRFKNKVIKVMCPYPTDDDQGKGIESEVRGFKIMESVNASPIPSLIDYGPFVYTDTPRTERKITVYEITSCVEGKRESFENLALMPGAIDDIAKFLVHLHSKRPETLRNTEDPFSWRIEYIANKADKGDKEMISYLADFYRSIPLEEKVLVHGDVNPGNFLIHDGQVAGFIDFCETGISAKEGDWCHIAPFKELSEKLTERYSINGGKRVDQKRIYMFSAINNMLDHLYDREVGREEEAAVSKKWALEMFAQGIAY